MRKSLQRQIGFFPVSAFSDLVVTSIPLVREVRHETRLLPPSRCLCGVRLNAQSNPVPFIDELLPTSTAPGGPGVTLTLSGGNFASSSVVLWNGVALATHFVSQARLTATVPASEIAKASTASVTLLNPGAPVSNVAFFSVTNPAPSPIFTGATSLTTGEPQSLVTADFNGDGRWDVAVANSDNTIAVLLGNGDGTFQPDAKYPANFYPAMLATGDFNGDGAVDLVITNSDSAAVSVLINNGDGTFRAPVSSGTVAIPNQLLTGDFNRDGKLDVVVGAQSSISILLGNGDGTFQPQKTVSTSGTYAMCAGDFNGDGILDLASILPPNVSIFLGNGDGTFQPPQFYTVGSNMLSFTLVTGDVNGDGILDLAAAYHNGAAILLGNGNGSFGTATFINAFSADDTIPAIADVNGDGNPDLLIVSSAANAFAVLLGKGDGTFQASGDFQAGEHAVATSFGDFDNDGTMDLALAANGYPGRDGGSFVALQTTGPSVSLSKLSVRFPIKVYNTRSYAQSVQLSNVGKETLMINKINIQGPNPHDYLETNNCGGSVAAGGSCVIQVVFKPIFKGERRAMLVINDNAIGSEQSVPLSGLGTFVTVSPNQLDFGDQKLGTTSPPQNLTVKNVGPQEVDVSSITISSYFYDHGREFHNTNTCSVIAPGSECAITVTFAPTVTGAAKGELWVHNDGGGQAQDVDLKGTGTK